jgi:hypothetical protein
MGNELSQKRKEKAWTKNERELIIMLLRLLLPENFKAQIKSGSITMAKVLSIFPQRKELIGYIYQRTGKVHEFHSEDLKNKGGR